MLQRVDFDNGFEARDVDQGHLLKPSFYLGVLKRRWPYFVFPFAIVCGIGVTGALLWPAVYLSEGKVLVQSQQIPTELVRPTVTSAAQERIQIIQQRTMTRDNLMQIADKFRLFPDKRSLMSATELVEEIRAKTKITPVVLELDFKQRGRDPAIVFSIGFEYSDPETATKVANELMTRFLNEDLRDRTSRATDTTRFLEREVQRLQGENAAIDAKISSLRVTQGKPANANAVDPRAATIVKLRADLVQMSGIYSDKHPIVQGLKKQLEAIEKSVATGQSGASAEGARPAAGAASNDVDVLVAQQSSLQTDLEAASSKLAAARLGEKLEKDQQSEKLEVIEQPTAPQNPVKPNRPKIIALAVLLAFAVGGGLAALREISDRAIRRSSDVFSIVDSKLIVTIPYIETVVEVQRRRRRLLVLSGISVLVLVALSVAAYFFMPPLDLLIAKARVGIFR